MRKSEGRQVLDDNERLRQVTHRRGTVAQLTERVAAPREDTRVICSDDNVLVPCSHVNEQPLEQDVSARHVLGVDAELNGAVAELSVSVVAECDQISCLGQHEREIFAGNDLLNRPWRGREVIEADVDRCPLIEGRAVTQLTVLVRAPCIEPVVV